MSRFISNAVIEMYRNLGTFDVRRKRKWNRHENKTRSNAITVGAVSNKLKELISGSKGIQIHQKSKLSSCHVMKRPRGTKSMRRANSQERPR